MRGAFHTEIRIAGGQSTAGLGKLMQSAERDLAAWCDEQEARLDAGKVRIVGDR